MPFLNLTRKNNVSYVSSMKNTDKIKYKITFYELLQNFFGILWLLNLPFLLLQAIPTMIQCAVILYRVIFGHASVLSLIHDILFFNPIQQFPLIELPFSISPLVSIVFSLWLMSFCDNQDTSCRRIIETLEETLRILCPKCGSESEIVSEEWYKRKRERQEYKESPIENSKGKQVFVMKTPIKVKYTEVVTNYTRKCKSCGHTWIT